MKRKTWVLAAVAVLVAVTVTGGVVAMSSAEQATPAAQEPPANTATVVKGKLSAMVSLDGTLTYRARSDGSPYSAINQASGVYTKLPEDGDRARCFHGLVRLTDTVPIWDFQRPLTYGGLPDAVRALARLGAAA